MPFLPSNWDCMWKVKKKNHLSIRYLSIKMMVMKGNQR